ncbi:Ribulose-5-phosphate 4-epimerase and related epimerase and aldolase [Pyrodictium delaneyi]|uniref:Ribulose-5-phosphate 4-epimerase and related epimerase and aldolase n=1 Tax=Pyrodictium delaneyi TaxID=1273541 RepID=A0A0P0N4J0_9CREN|nr:class II aldolase/adducin family protein [Pyrodictium delaneyi]ALL01350.1 Ribulose-5-phosphate 4-epimerase and related epimerase and aldolase [Pyrodictium delaneyi]
MALRQPGYEIRQTLVDAMRILHDRGLLNLRGGNASAVLELPDGTRFIYITPSGAIKTRMKPEDIAVMSPEGYVYEGKPSSEYRLHLAVYRTRSDVRAIVHAHNPYAVLARRLGLELRPEALGVEARYYLGNCVAAVPEVEPGTEELARLAAEALRDCDVAVLEGHGAVAIGVSKDPVEAVYEAVDRLEALEDLARAVVYEKLLRG